jgi:hypothetical protein
VPAAPAAGELPDVLELDELMSPLGLDPAPAPVEGECELLAPVRGVADATAPDVPVRIPAALALGEAFGAALTLADGEVDGVIEAAGLALIEGEALPYGFIDAAGEALALVDAAVPVL